MCRDLYIWHMIVVGIGGGSGDRGLDVRDDRHLHSTPLSLDGNGREKSQGRYETSTKRNNEGMKGKKGAFLSSVSSLHSRT